MHLGRFLFGVGGESLSVAQSRITAKWFKGKELALALGMNLAMGRLGSVLNDLLSPHLAEEFNIHAAIWFGTVTCLLSFLAGQYLLKLDQPISPQFQRLDRSDESLDGDIEMMASRSPTAQSPIRIKEMLNFSSFTPAFWLLCAIMCLYYAADIPFNAIHSSFLQLRFRFSSIAAAQIMSIPDTLSAIFVPFCGLFVDLYGHRCKVMIVCGLIMTSVHLFFATSTVSSPSPIPALVFLGLSYALLLTFWPAMALIVPEHKLSTAFGIGTSLLNATLAFTPVIVAFTLQMDQSYTTTESFFVFVCFIGFICSIILWYYDRIWQKGILEKVQLKGKPIKDSEDNLISEYNGSS
jgi:nitrate/nitrite transporter NarK